MYTMTQYLNEEMVGEAMAALAWPVAYGLEDEMPEGINVAFPNSNFYFVEGLGGRVSALFLPEDTGDEQMSFTIQDALEVLAPEVETRGYDFFHVPGEHSPELVRKGVERCCGLIHAHLMAVVEGDFSWVPEAKRRRVVPREPDSGKN